MENIQKGFFISFEGIDGAGKSTHIDAFGDLMRMRYPDKKIVMTRARGYTVRGEFTQTPIGRSNAHRN